ncbi:MAG: hypothetical protein INR65_14195, partial [Gluconacetobacter diazotrophicus]|nr:hypothetical protein [Gluconacetobacter diazotrophicus]
MRLHRRALIQAGLAVLTAQGTQAADGPLPRAQAFVDSVGVNTHLSSEPYASALGEVQRLLARSGIRHLRDELPAAADVERWRRLSDAVGLRFDLLVSPAKNKVEDIPAIVRALGVARLSSLEGQNEGDSDWFMAQPAARPSWDRAVVAYQRAAYRAVRALYEPATLPFLSPTVLDYRPQDMLRIREAAPWSDVVAVHSYVQHGQEPETT